MLTTRITISEDLTGLRAILNHIIRAGGTTAHEEEMSQAGFRRHYFEDPDTCITVLSGSRAIGFQATFKDADGHYSVGSFTDQANPVRGAGAALFAATIQAVRALGGTTIIAKITADNAPGLAYYSKMGCEDWKIMPGDAMRNGQPVDRIVKRFEV